MASDANLCRGRPVAASVGVLGSCDGRDTRLDDVGLVDVNSSVGPSVTDGSFGRGVFSGTVSSPEPVCAASGTSCIVRTGRGISG